MEKLYIYLIIGGVLLIIGVVITVVLLTRKKSTPVSYTCSLDNPKGTCPGGQTCVNGVCVGSCTPNCSGKVCGGDGCGGSCGVCAPPKVCSDGKCVEGTQGYSCSVSGCSADCALPPSRENFTFAGMLSKMNDAENTCYRLKSLCQQNCTQAPCGPNYPIGYCPKGSLCDNGECTLPVGCPYPGSTLSQPNGLADGNYTILYQGNPLVGGSQTAGAVAMIGNAIAFSPTPVWVYKNNTLTMQPTQTLGSCQLQARDECWKTNCGNPSGNVCTGISASAPSGIVRCLSNVLPTSPQYFILGPNFIYSIEAKAYLIPDTRPLQSGNTCGSCQQGNSPPLYQFVTYTTDESQAAVWSVSAA